MILELTLLSCRGILPTVTLMNLLFLHLPSIAFIAAELLLLIAFVPPYGENIGWVFLL